MSWDYLVGGVGDISKVSPSHPHSRTSNVNQGILPPGLYCTRYIGPAGGVSPDKWDPLPSSWGRIPLRSGLLLCDRVGTPYSLSFPYWCTVKPDQTSSVGCQNPTVAGLTTVTQVVRFWHKNIPPSIEVPVHTPLYPVPLYPLSLPPLIPSAVGPRLPPHWRSWGRADPPESCRSGPNRGAQSIQQLFWSWPGSISTSGGGVGTRGPLRMTQGCTSSGCGPGIHRLYSYLKISCKGPPLSYRSAIVAYWLQLKRYGCLFPFGSRGRCCKTESPPSGHDSVSPSGSSTGIPLYRFLGSCHSPLR